jgi:hypothetical protein
VSSSSEAEYFAVNEVATELKFMKMVLGVLEIDSPDHVDCKTQ